MKHLIVTQLPETTEAKTTYLIEKGTDSFNMVITDDNNKRRSLDSTNSVLKLDIKDINLKSLTKKQLLELKNRLENEIFYSISLDLSSIGGSWTFYHNGERKVYLDSYKKLYLEEGGRITLKSEGLEDYFGASVGNGMGEVFGKNLPDFETGFNNNGAVNLTLFKVETDKILEKKRISVKAEGETQFQVDTISPFPADEYLSGSSRLFYYGYEDQIKQDAYITDNKVKLSISGVYGNKRVIFQTASGEELARQEPVRGSYYQSFEIELPYHEEYKLVFEDAVVIVPRTENNELPTLTSSDGREDLPEIIPDREKDVPAPVEESAT